MPSLGQLATPDVSQPNLASIEGDTYIQSRLRSRPVEHYFSSHLVPSIRHILASLLSRGQFGLGSPFLIPFIFLAYIPAPPLRPSWWLTLQVICVLSTPSAPAHP